jgi:hypothetical protein
MIVAKDKQLTGQIDIFGNVTKEVEKIKKKRKTKATEEERIVEFNKMLDHEPPKEWVKVNKNFDNSKYLPIRIVEALLKSVFGVYQVEESNPIRIVADNIIYSVSLKVYHPVIKEWITFSGVGAAPLRSNEKGISIALHGNAPMARAFAVTNAAKSIGKLFGSALNNLEDEMIDIYSDEFKKIKKEKGSVGKLLDS